MLFTHINYGDHPTNRNKMVFHFKVKEHADYFENLLNQNHIKFESQTDVEGDGKIYYGVLKTDYTKAKELNFITFGHFRKPFINDPFFKYFIVIITVLAIVIGIIGAIKAM